VNSSVSYGLDGPGCRIPVGARDIFSSAERPNRLWGPPCLESIQGIERPEHEVNDSLNVTKFQMLAVEGFFRFANTTDVSDTKI
jgi:hypothetical protein